MGRCVQGRSAEEPKSMLLICSSTYFASFGYFLAYHRARRLGFGHGTRAGHICSHLYELTLAWTFFLFFGISSSASSSVLWRVTKERLCG